jgi:hypothetical protein
MTNPKQLAEQYERGVQSARQRFNDSLAVQTLTSSEAGDELLVLFLINYCAYGVGMTKPVESWISRVGDRCIEKGFAEEGHIFKRHALQKTNHHLFLVNDLKSLTAYWNERFEHPHLIPEQLLQRPTPPGVLQYQVLHEKIVAGDEPFRQFAVEYEIDRLSLEYGAWLVSRCLQRFGKVFLARTTFLQKDVAFDVAQTQFNWLGMGKLLAAHPTFLMGLTETGIQALDSYQQFLADCVLESERLAKTVDLK